MIPEEPHIYIGGLEALDDFKALASAKITHILTVLDYDHCDWEEYKAFQRLYIESGDLDSVDITKHFNTSNEFLDTAISKGGTVLVHCAFGVSRSSALVMAFLMSKRGKSFDEALETIRKGRRFAAPNMGFEEQLKVYEKTISAKLKDEETASAKPKVEDTALQQKLAASKGRSGSLEASCSTRG